MCFCVLNAFCACVRVSLRVSVFLTCVWSILLYAYMSLRVWGWLMLNKAYFKMARLYHPDKNPDDADADLKASCRANRAHAHAHPKLPSKHTHSHTHTHSLSLSLSLFSLTQRHKHTQTQSIHALLSSFSSPFLFPALHFVSFYQFV